MLSLCLLLASWASAQSCEPYSDYSSVCLLHLPSGAQVFIPPGMTQQNLSDIAAANLPQTNILPPPCGFYAQQRICLETFRVCAPDGIPAPLCPGACTSYNSQCIMPGIVPSAFSNNCSSSDPYLPGEQLYETTAQRNNSITCINSFFFGQLWAGQPSGCASVLTGTISKTFELHKEWIASLH